MVERPASVVVLRVLAYLGLLFVLVLQGLVLSLTVRPWSIPVEELLTDGDRFQLWLAQLPLAVVGFTAICLLIRVTNAVLAGDPFQPATLRALRLMAMVIGFLGTIAQFVYDQVTQEVIQRIAMGNGEVTFRLPFGWIIGGLLVALVGAIVAEGVRRSAPPAFPQGSYAGPAGPPLR